MKKFHQNYLGRSNEAGKREHKLKKHHSEEACKRSKNLAPFVKLHWHDCPLVNKQCPIHGNRFICTDKEENPDLIQNVTISFYPSLKPEKLFQPFKTLLAHCNPEAKISFQNYTQKNFPDKENTKDRFIQTNSEDFKRGLNNVFAEKTKSFITKTKKMKKLKQCFYSPCNSIARRSFSQTSVREKRNEIPYEEGQHRNAFFNSTLEEPFDDVTCDSSFEWFPSRKLDFENLVKLSGEKKNSDFITFPKGTKNSDINHKIFEVKHKKSLNDKSAVNFPKQSTQFVYSTYDIRDSPPNQKNKKTFFKKKKTPPNAENMKERKNDDASSISEKSLSSSSDSVYITPFFLMPEDKDFSKLIDRATSTMIEPIQTKDLATEKSSAITVGTQTTFQRADQMESPWEEKPQLKSISIQTEQLESPSKDKSQLKSISVQTEQMESPSNEQPQLRSASLEGGPIIKEKSSQTTRESFLRDYEPSLETLKDEFKDFDRITIKDEIGDDIAWRRKCSEESKINTSNLATEVQTEGNSEYQEQHEKDLCSGNIKNQSSQTEPRESQKVFWKTVKSETETIQMTYQTHKGTQTSFSEDSSSDFSNSAEFHSSNVIIVKSSNQEEPQQADEKMAKVWWGKSCSETELYEKKKCKCLTPEICLCKRSNLIELSNVKESAAQSASPPFLQNNPHVNESNTFSKTHKTIPQTQKREEPLSKAEQTSLKHEHIPQALSDLSELKKIILKYFEKTRPEENISKVDKAKDINVKIDQGTMTDSTIIENKPAVNVTQKLRIMNTTGTQTTIHILMDDEIEKSHSLEPKVKFRQSVLLGDKNEDKTFFVCALCGRDISRYCVNASTSTDNHDNFPKIKEKTTVIDTKYSKIVEVKTCKKSKNAFASVEPTSNFKPTIKPITHTEIEKPARTFKTTEISCRDINLQKSCIPILITEPGPACVRKDRNLPVLECRNLKPLGQEWPECSKSTNSQAKQKPQCPIPPATRQLPKQCICDEVSPPSTTQPISTSLDPLKPQKLKIQPKEDICSSLPKVEHPGVENSQWRKEERSQLRSNPKSDFRKTDRFYYPAGIKSFWPIEVRKGCEPADKSDDFLCSGSKQKRSYEKELELKDIPAGKKIKAFCDEPKKECFLFGRPMLSDFLKGKHEKGSGSIWVPSSSVPQVPSPNDFLNQFKKITKSEEFVRISPQRETPVRMKKCDSDTSSELFAVESCHLKPVTLKYDQRPFNDLFECSICKSLTFLKTNKENMCFTWPNTTLSFHGRVTELNSIEKIPKESIPDNPSQIDEEFLQENLDFSDTTSLPLEESGENNILEEEEEEIINKLKESYLKSKPQRSESKTETETQTPNVSDPSFHPDVSSGSDFSNTFRVSKDRKKYKFKKHSK